MSWAWWDWPLTWLTNHRPSVLWHCWLGHVTLKTVSKMTCNVPSGTLNSTIPFLLTSLLSCLMTTRWLVRPIRVVIPFAQTISWFAFYETDPVTLTRALLTLKCHCELLFPWITCTPDRSFNIISFLVYKLRCYTQTDSDRFILWPWTLTFVFRVFTAYSIWRVCWSKWVLSLSSMLVQRDT